MLTALAGVNGAGKSSVLGSVIRAAGDQYYNPDEITQDLLINNLRMPLGEANSTAWKIGFDQLNTAIDREERYTFETTLGGSSITEALIRAVDIGRHVTILYCGLKSPELHIERVLARVNRGGHTIPEDKIRERYVSSIHNAMRVLGTCYQFKLFDNSAPLVGAAAQPVTLFHLRGTEFITPPIDPMPEWAKPLAFVAVRRITNKG